jgi:hypothetical protein
MKDSKAALQWIVAELRGRGIPFVVTGGLAVNAHQGSRPLNDIDIDVPDAALDMVARELAQYVVFGPEHYVGECFDCKLLGLRYRDQEIELSGADTFKVRDAKANMWCSWPIDLSAFELREVLGQVVPVTRLDELLRYKRAAAREVDTLDCAELTAISRSR